MSNTTQNFIKGIREKAKDRVLNVKLSGEAVSIVQSYRSGSKSASEISCDLIKIAHEVVQAEMNGKKAVDSKDKAAGLK